MIRKKKPAPEKTESNEFDKSNKTATLIEMAPPQKKPLQWRDIIDAIDWAMERKPSLQRINASVVRVIVPDILPVPGEMDKIHPVVYQCFAETWTVAIVSCFLNSKAERAKIVGCPTMPKTN